MKETLWGGRQGEGLLYVVNQMRESVTDLVRTVKMVITDVNGTDGVRADMRSLRSDLSLVKNAEDRIEQRKEKEHVAIHERITNIEIHHIKKIEDRIDRLESVKINATTVQDWRETASRAREEMSKRIDTIEERVEEMRTRGMTSVTAWSAIIASTVLSLLSLYFGRQGH